MAAKRALVVDDSKSARIVLSRMLEKYAIEVDAAESAEAALEYLRANRPDVIFMDHMMPGMDGLQAVRQIKSNPEIATIPIMMYTSQEGELYAGQARALGAVGVLPKSIRPIDVTKALYQLNLLPDRRDIELPVLQPYQGELAAAEAAARSEADAAAAIPMRGQFEAMLREQNLELRRFMLVTLDSHAHRISAELRPPVPDPLPELAPPPRPLGWMLATLSALAALTVVGLLYWQSLQAMSRANAAIEAATAANLEMQGLLAELRADRSAAVEPLPAIAGEVPRVTTLQVPFGEASLSPARLDALRGMLAQLEREGLRGKVLVSSYAGSFCLNSVGEQGYTLAQAASPAANCEQIGNPHADQQGGVSRQPVAFANLAATVQSRTGGEIELLYSAGVRDQVAVEYPAIEQATAGQWNAAAQANNRIEIVVQPSE